MDTYYKFAKDVEKIKKTALVKITNILNENKKIIGFGAPAKATTILNYFGLSEKQFKYVIDDNPLKHSKFIPGTNIKILNKKNVINKNYDVVLILAWNFFDSIIKNNKKLFPNSKFMKLK